MVSVIEFETRVVPVILAVVSLSLDDATDAVKSSVDVDTGSAEKVVKSIFCVTFGKYPLVEDVLKSTVSIED